MARYFLHNHGVDLDQIDFAYLPSNNGARAFQLGRLDAIILPEPMVTITLNNYDQAVLSWIFKKNGANSMLVRSAFLLWACLCRGLCQREF